MDISFNTYLYQPGDYPTTMQATYSHPDQKIFKALAYQVGTWIKPSEKVLDQNKLIKHLWNNGAYIIYNNEEVLSYAITKDGNKISWSLLVHLLRCIRQELKINIDQSADPKHQWLCAPEFNLTN